MSSSGSLAYANASGVLSALAQYSGDPRTEWQLNAHKDKKSLLQAVANLPYKGGNTLTGESILGLKVEAVQGKQVSLNGRRHLVDSGNGGTTLWQSSWHQDALP